MSSFSSKVATKNLFDPLYATMPYFLRESCCSIMSYVCCLVQAEAGSIFPLGMLARLARGDA